MTVNHPDYGIDAPGLVKGFFLGGLSAIACAGSFYFVARRGRPWALAGVGVAGISAAYLMGMGCYMLYGSKVAKVRGRERLLDLIPWTASDTVLDVGCGRGLLLIAAARRVPRGRAVGIDLWQAVDQSNNTAEATLANARLEGVAGRVDVKTADVRQLPFADGSFDVIVSHWAVHNIDAPDGRAKALNEMHRVLRPGGHILITDIGHTRDYAGHFTRLGYDDVRRVVDSVADAVRSVMTFGSFRPASMVARKPVGTQCGYSDFLKTGDSDALADT